MPRTGPELHSPDEEIPPREDDGGVPAGEDGLIGRLIGSYRVTKLLGRGGMGAVYVGEHPMIGSRVAIKLLHPRYAADPAIVERFFNEARAVNLIGHDNILEILDLDVTEDGRHYFVMELLHGTPLQDLVRPGIPVPLRVAGPILLQICDALQAAHERGIVHRDLKPGNVHLTVHQGRKHFVKVVDFGIARVCGPSGASRGSTQAGAVLGTPAYMSPEQAAGQSGRIDGRSDVYSLGCMMFQMATGHIPFPDANLGEALVAHLQLPPPRPRALVPEIPAAWEAAILRCLEKKPEARYQSMREVHDALARAMAELGIPRELPAANAAEIAAARATQGSPRPAPRRASPLQRRRAGGKGLWLGAGAGALALAGGLAFLVLQQAEESRRETERAQLAAERVALQAREAARRAEEEQARLAHEQILLSVVSDPEGAAVEAAWNGGVKAAVTPFQLFVPRNASVHFAFSKRDFLSWAIDVIADAPKVVRASLAQAKAAPARRAAQVKAQVPQSRARQASAEMKDDTIPVDF